nr:MAG TPA: hypothetical protein [Caudoviricetes sp.]
MFIIRRATRLRQKASRQDLSWRRRAPLGSRWRA